MQQVVPASNTPAPPNGVVAKIMQTIKLKDGRSLGFAQFGEPNAFPVFYFHGWPGSRLEAGFFDTPGVQMIGIDRPGYGLSDPQPNRRLADWPPDVEAIADHLNLGRFAIVGMSGGGPYAAACAHALTERIHKVAIIAGLGPPEAPGMSKDRVGTLLSVGKSRVSAQMLLGLMRSVLRTPSADRLFARFRSRLPRASKDAEALTPIFFRLLLASFREGLRNSSKGASSDAFIYGQTWPFALHEIRSKVHVWHGTDDRQVPVSIGRHYAKHIPNARGTFLEGDGHISIVANHLNAILTDLKNP